MTPASWSRRRQISRYRLIAMTPDLPFAWRAGEHIGYEMTLDDEDDFSSLSGRADF